MITPLTLCPPNPKDGHSTLSSFPFPPSLLLVSASLPISTHRPSPHYTPLHSTLLILHLLYSHSLPHISRTPTLSHAHQHCQHSRQPGQRIPIATHTLSHPQHVQDEHAASTTHRRTAGRFPRPRKCRFRTQEAFTLLWRTEAIDGP